MVMPSDLRDLLDAATEPLRQAFGAPCVLQVRELATADGPLMQVTVQLPATYAGDPERALQAFEEDWWIHHCHQCGGALAFDYELAREDTV